MTLPVDVSFDTALSSLQPGTKSESPSKAPSVEPAVPPGKPAATDGANSGFRLVQQWHSQPRKLRIIHVGAGATGLCAAYKFERQLTNYKLVCYEKNTEVGGTWLQNRYPGCACDVPAHIYTYTFEPWSKWKSYYAYSPDIHEYFINFCDKYSLRKYIKLQHRVVAATWREERGKWEVEVEHSGQTFTDWCDILVNGSGLLNKARWPDIEGLRSFKGELVHTGEWNGTLFKLQTENNTTKRRMLTIYSGSANCKDKRIAVIGNGSSAIQVIPQMQKIASHLKCVMRGSTWISPPMPRIPVDIGGEEFDDKRAAQPDTSQYFYSEREMAHLAADPEYQLNYRKRIEHAINMGFAIFYKDTEASHQAELYMRAEMNRRLNNHPVLSQKLVPTWPVGCRRLTPGDGYLEALIEPNVECIFGEIACITETGLEMADGSSHEVDVIICATGYDMAWTPHFKLVGRNGRDIKDAWSPMPKCYLGMAAPGFPNYFVMNGPRGNLANGTVLPCFETELEYVIQAARKMQSDRIRTLDVREHAVDQLNEYIDAWHETSVFSASCKSWYKNNTRDGQILVWGGSSVHFLKTIKTPRWEHYDIDYLDGNMWSFLGNGRIEAETTGDFDRLTPYIRNSDEPWTIE
ncbi:putative sterigmatocystin biosynthesis monooxygenase stcW [Colletotrichum liriopes]|uniref:Sterigmatocystin biosynthesis monooxygenase stcW n=1 Tax=Colletotrichum liriopes TaxID=708192 RepID=A0AA37GT61_9PEZI|nr:putative sterigmatocystin biosynthesis monooxygenase stcW [Colletotrichum liriopes]